MKRIILILLTIIAVSCNEKAIGQVSLFSASTGGAISNITSNTFDTLTNTTAKYFITREGALKSNTVGNYMHYFTAKTLTGTPATVTIVQEGSIDGVTWYGLTGCAGTDGRNCDTLTFTPTTERIYVMSSNAGGGKLVYSANHVNVGGRWLYTRLRCIPSGTQTLRISSPKNLPFSK